jgi:GNAT superfamily N-acetyltransferase
MRPVASVRPSSEGRIVPTASNKPVGGRVLPAEISRIRLDYRLQTGWDETPSDGPSFWHVSADVHDLESETATAHVGSFVFYRIEPLDTDDLFGVMDGYDADLGHMAELLIDLETGELTDDLRDHLAGLDSDILAVCRAELEEDWRGFGLGAVLAGQAIRQLRHGCLCVALQPASLVPRSEQVEETRRRTVKKISKAWESIGFTCVGDDLMVLDLATTTLSKSLARQRALARRLPFAGTDEDGPAETAGAAATRLLPAQPRRNPEPGPPESR